MCSDLLFVILVAVDVLTYEDINAALTTSKPTRALLLVWILGK